MKKDKVLHRMSDAWVEYRKIGYSTEQVKTYMKEILLSEGLSPAESDMVLKDCEDMVIQKTMTNHYLDQQENPS